MQLGFGVATTVDPEKLLNMKAELLQAMQETKKDLKLSHLLFAITDILEGRSFLLILGDAELKLAEKAYNGQTKDQILDLGDLTSRKSEFVPILMKSLPASCNSMKSQVNTKPY